MFLGVYGLADASNVFPGQRARLFSPILGDKNTERCLTFNYFAYGENIGSLRVFDQEMQELWDVDPGNSTT